MVPIRARRRLRIPGPGWLWGAASLLALIVLVSALAQALLAHGERELALQAAQPGPASPQYTFQLTAVAAVAPSDVWAFGVRTNNAAQPARGPQPSPTASGSCQVCSIILHYDGHAWTRVPLDASLAATDPQPIMTSVAMLSPREGWAAGGASILHDQDGVWKVAYTLPTAPQQGSTLMGISMASASEGWAVGSQTTFDASTTIYTETALLLHYAHGTWMSVATPPLPDYQVVRLNGVSAPSSGEAWAVGEAYTATGAVDLALHYTQGKWQVMPTGLPAPLSAVSAVGAGEAWATGSENPGTGPGLILHYRAGTWARVASPTPTYLHAIAMRTATDGWIGGDGAAMLHYDGAGRTQMGLVLHGFEIDGIVAASPTEAWAIGGYRFGTNPNDTTTLLRYSDGRWSPYPLSLGD
jgi:hypothetical protein